MPIEEQKISPKELELMRLRIRDLDFRLEACLKTDKLKDEFVTIVSHEIRTPLTIIKGNIANLMDGILGNLTEKQRMVVEMTNRNTDRLIRLINDLLDFSNMENGHVEPHWTQVDIGALVKEAMNNFETVAKTRKISLKEDLPRKLPKWKTDPDLAAQILINLIDHALQFAKKEAKVIVKEDGKEIQITVMDDGPHIPNEEPGVIFNKTVPLYRPFGSVGHRGTGLILALCKEKARWLHGRMRVENYPDGAKVHLILPK